jgi:hypothetical protein
MRMLWWIPVSLLAVGAGLFLRNRLRRHSRAGLTSEPVSADWLAQARGREERDW